MVIVANACYKPEALFSDKNKRMTLAGTWRRNDALTSVQRFFDVMYLLGRPLDVSRFRAQNAA